MGLEVPPSASPGQKSTWSWGEVWGLGAVCFTTECPSHWQRPINNIRDPVSKSESGQGLATTTRAEGVAEIISWTNWSKKWSANESWRRENQPAMRIVKTPPLQNQHVFHALHCLQACLSPSLAHLAFRELSQLHSQLRDDLRVLKCLHSTLLQGGKGI